MTIAELEVTELGETVTTTGTKSVEMLNGALDHLSDKRCPQLLHGERGGLEGTGDTPHRVAVRLV